MSANTCFMLAIGLFLFCAICGDRDQAATFLAASLVILAIDGRKARDG